MCDEDPPDEVISEEIKRLLFDEDTVDKVPAELTSKDHRVAEGDRLGKIISFVKNQVHAEFIARRFDAQYPQYAGTFARVITHSTAYAQSLIDDFSVTNKAPHIAISVAGNPDVKFKPQALEGVSNATAVGPEHLLLDGQ